jgi:hypothetical protein
MKIFSTRLLFLIIPLTLILSCKKDGLTKATQNGANTFSCKINGKAFQPCRDEVLFGSPSLWGGVSISAITIARVTAKCFYTNFPKRDISIELSDFHGLGEYPLSDPNNRGIYNEYIPVLPLIKTYESLYTTTGKIIITKDDRTNFILSGTFEFKAANKDNTNDIITITDGGFDISYKR